MLQGKQLTFSGFHSQDSSAPNFCAAKRAQQSGDQVAMKMATEARPHKFMEPMMNFLIRPMVAKAVESDMDAIKVFCEKR